MTDLSGYEARNAEREKIKAAATEVTGELRWATPEHSAARNYLANAAEHLLQATACVRAATRVNPSIPTPESTKGPA